MALDIMKWKLVCLHHLLPWRTHRLNISLLIGSINIQRCTGIAQAKAQSIQLIHFLL